MFNRHFRMQFLINSAGAMVLGLIGAVARYGFGYQGANILMLIAGFFGTILLCSYLILRAKGKTLQSAQDDLRSALEDRKRRM